MMERGAEKYVLAIDLGTGGPKVALFDAFGTLVASAFNPTPLNLLPGGGAEQEPEDWWRAIVAGAQQVMAGKHVPEDQIVAVACSAQWVGTVAIDRTGRPLMPAVIWMDSRGAPYIAAKVDGPIKLEGYAVHRLLPWLRKTGGVPARSGKDSLAHMLFIKEERPSVYRDAWKFLEPGDWLGMRMTGVCATTMNSITLTWVTDNRDIRRIHYDDALLQMAGIDREKLPELLPVNAVLGPLLPEIARQLGIPAGIPVVTASPDVMGAAVGSGAVKDYDGHVYIGTSSWITCHVPYKKVDPFRSITSLPSAIPGRYFVACEQETAGACMNFLRDNLLFAPDGITPEPPKDLFPRLDVLAAAVAPGSEGLLFLPWLYGERTPVENNLLRGGFFNLSLRATRAHMVRAVLEGVALNLRWLQEAVENFTGTRFAWLNFIGGGARSPLWCQILADVLERPIRQVQDPILANVRGAAFLTLISTGHMTFADIPSRVKILNTYEPNQANQAVYRELFREFVGFHSRNHGALSRMNREGSPFRR